MKDFLTPDYMFATFDEVTPAFLQSIGVRALLIDIDNTLAPYEEPDPSQKILDWFADLENAGTSAAPWSSQPLWVDVVLVASVVSYSLRSHGL